MSNFEIVKPIGLSIDGQIYKEGDVFECDASRMKKHLAKGNVKELKVEVKTKELKGAKATK